MLSEAQRPSLLVYAPFSFNGRGPAESCASIVGGFPPSAFTTTVFAGRFRKKVAGQVRLHESLPGSARHLPWRMVGAGALSRLNQDYERALRAADPATTIAYFWPDPPVELVRLARDRGIVTVREMINSACATSGPILDEAYARLNLPAHHPATAEKIAAETEELRAHDFLFASNPEVEQSLLRLSLSADQILRTTFGWTPERLAPSGGTVPHERLRLLFVGTLSVRKGVPELLESWRASGLDGELVLAGKATPDVASLLNAQVLPKGVRTLGYVKNVGDLFSSADVFVFPTLEEGGPQVTYEAAGCGLPVITTPMGAARLVESGVTGVVVDAGSSSQLTEAMKLLGTNDDLRATLGAAARRRAADFTYPKVAKQRAELLTAALKAHRV